MLWAILLNLIGFERQTMISWTCYVLVYWDEIATKLECFSVYYNFNLYPWFRLICEFFIDLLLFNDFKLLPGNRISDYKNIENAWKQTLHYSKRY